MEGMQEALIRAIWAEKSRQAWNPVTNGRGQPLHIEGLTVWLTNIEMLDGRNEPAVECDGVIVDRSPPPMTRGSARPNARRGLAYSMTLTFSRGNFFSTMS